VYGDHPAVRVGFEMPTNVRCGKEVEDVVVKMPWRHKGREIRVVKAAANALDLHPNPLSSSFRPSFHPYHLPHQINIPALSTQL
jgi:hypothetical protein